VILGALPGQGAEGAVILDALPGWARACGRAFGRAPGPCRCPWLRFQAKREASMQRTSRFYVGMIKTRQQKKTHSIIKRTSMVQYPENFQKPIDDEEADEVSLPTRKSKKPAKNR